MQKLPKTEAHGAGRTSGGSGPATLAELNAVFEQATQEKKEPAQAPPPVEAPSQVQPTSVSADPLGMYWYILQTYSGYENRVKRTIEEQLRIQNLSDDVEEIFVPGEDVTRMRHGKKRKMHVIYFPGYVLIKMRLSVPLRILLMDIPRVSGFVGSKDQVPQPMEESALNEIRSQIHDGFRQSTIKDEFETGQEVVVIDGPFTNFSGKIDEVSLEKRKLRVLISILGRATPVELDFGKVRLQTGE